MEVIDIDGLTWRPAAAEDTPFLFALFAAHKAAEFAPLQLPEEQLRPLLDMQFRARQMSTTQNNPNALDTVLCLADGTRVGRHLVECQSDGYRTIDLAVLPEYRNCGIASWALRRFQQLAEIEGVPMRLSVSPSNPALRLYERLGFRTISADQVALEMEWQPSRPAPCQPAMPRPEAQIALSSGDTLNRSAVLDQIFSFLREIGLTVQFGPVPESFLPGIRFVSGGLQVDLDTLLYPGDLLHEAGHLAIMTPERRLSTQPEVTDISEEIAAQAWSYAAALHLGLSPEVVFHEHGYKGKAQGLLAALSSANGFGVVPGVPLLAWMGLTTQPTPSQPSIFPRMLRWLREEQPQTLELEPEKELAFA